MSDAARTSPFFFGGAVPPDKFIGRERELHDLLARVSNSGCMSIVGERGIGKSSLLRYAVHVHRREAPNPKLRLFAVDMQSADFDKTRAGFLTHILRQLLAEVVYTGAHEQALRALDKRLKRGETFDMPAFAEALRLIKATGQIVPVVCIDEFEGFFEYPQEFDKQFFDNLRWLNNTEQTIAWVTASRVELSEVFKHFKLTSSLPRNFERIRLGDFTHDEADLLLKRADFTPEERQKLLEIAGRHPARLQAAADLYYHERARNTGDWTAFKQRYHERIYLLEQSIAAKPDAQARSSMSLPCIVSGIGKLAADIGEHKSRYEDKVFGMIIIVAVLVIIALALMGRLDVQGLLDSVFQRTPTP